MNLKNKYSESELTEINEILNRCNKLQVVDPWTKKSFILDEEAREILIKKYNFEITKQSNKKDSELSVKINVDTTELDEAIKKTNVLKQLFVTIECLSATVMHLKTELGNYKQRTCQD